MDFVTHHLRSCRLFYQWFAIVWVEKMQVFSPLQLLLYFWVYGPSEITPIDQSPVCINSISVCHFLHENNNILKILCQISLKIWSLVNFRLLNQTLMVKEMNSSANYAIMMLQFDLRFLKTFKNGQLPMEFWECGISDKVWK